MYFKIFILSVALLFSFKGYNANELFSNLAEEAPEKISVNEEIKVEDEKTKDDAVKRSLGRTRSRRKQSFGDLSLELAKLHILEQTVKKSKAIQNLQDEVNENSGDKCSKIKKVGEPIVHHHSGITYGTWMRDPLGLLGPEKIWYTYDYSGNQLLEFESMDHFKAGEIAKTYNLPYHFDGTGSAIYGRYLYFNRASTCNIVQYDLVTEKVVRQACPHGSIKSRQYQYEWGGRTTMDLSVDESGLWVLYSVSSYKGKLCATLLDPMTLGALHTYCGVSSEPMTSMGNAFVACGVIYSIDIYNSGTTTINFAYDTVTRSGKNPGIQFKNAFGYNSMVTYNPREKVLYAWDNKRQITYPLEFEE